MSALKTNLLQVSEIKISYRNKVKASERPKIEDSYDAYQIFLKHWDLDRFDNCEEFKIMLLNRANKVLGIVQISSGGLSGTVADSTLAQS